MPSPFPGMDPYLEDPVRWPDVHQRLITYIADALQTQLRPRYFARMGERVYVITPPHTMYPDVLLVERRAREKAGTFAASTSITPAEAPTEILPIIFTQPPVEHREPFVEIIHAAGEEIVTVIEILSPANKTVSEGRDQYLQKQRQILGSQAHLVEIDLLAAGQATIAIPREVQASLPAHRYIASTRRSSERYRYEMYPIPLAHVLPKVRVPLREPDPDVALDLQTVFERCYENGGYGDLIDYRRPPRAPLSAEETAWVDGLMKGKGKRK